MSVLVIDVVNESPKIALLVRLFVKGLLVVADAIDTWNIDQYKHKATMLSQALYHVQQRLY